MIEQLSLPVSDDDVRDLAVLVLDATAAGASVGFLDATTLESATEWWRQSISGAGERAIFLVARDEEGIAGTVQLRPASMPNQRHRADIAKLLVHRRARRQGVGRALMEAIEARARAAGFTLLTLDTVRGDGAERLYTTAGWQRVGVIPDYALYPDGRPCDTVVFYKNVSG